MDSTTLNTIVGIIGAIVGIIGIVVGVIGIKCVTVAIKINNKIKANTFQQAKTINNNNGLGYSDVAQIARETAQEETQNAFQPLSPEDIDAIIEK